MVVKPLDSEVAQSLSRGASPSDIKTILKGAGWPEEMIRDFVGRASAAAPRQLSGALLTLSGISKRFGPKIILQNADLRIQAKDIVGIVGPSGAGKTVLISIMVGALEPDTGSVAITKDGQPQPVLHNDAARTLIGFAPQVSACYAALTVWENLLHFAAIYGVDIQKREARAKELLGIFSLTDLAAQPVSNLSTGQQKRLDIACAIIHKPALLVCDDPLADLDPLSRNELWTALRTVNTDGTAIILTSHAHADLERYCTRVALIARQKLIDLGSPDQIRETYFKNYALTLQLDTPKYDTILRGIEAKGLAISSQRKADQLIIHTQQPQELLGALREAIGKSGAAIISLTIAKPTLKDVFERLVRE